MKPALEMAALPTSSADLSPLFVLVLSLLLSTAVRLSSALSLHPLHFGDDMILQRAPSRARIYGSLKIPRMYAKLTVTVTPVANPSAAYSVDIDTEEEIDKDTGEFSALLRPHESEEGEFTISVVCGKITDCAGKEPSKTAIIGGVLFGDVWFCAGQNNMALPLEYTLTRNQSAEAVKEGKYEKIRIFSIEGNMSWEQPWAKAADVLDSGDFFQYASTCWYFAEALADRLGAEEAPPIGVIHVSYGSSKIEDWLDDEALATCSDVLPRYSKKKEGWDETRVEPFTQMTLKGWIWYQGELDMQGTFGNFERHTGYACLLPALVKSWRGKWSQTEGTTPTDAPFGIVTLPPSGGADYPDVGAFRLAQTAGYGSVPNEALPNTFLAQAFDLEDPFPDPTCYNAGCCHPTVFAYQKDPPGPCSGEHCTQLCPQCDLYCAALDDTAFFMSPLHSRAKREVGVRLAQAAAVGVYGQDGAATGPTIKGCKVRDSGVLTIQFDRALLRGDEVEVRDYRGTTGLSKTEVLVDPDGFCLQRHKPRVGGALQCIDDGTGKPAELPPDAAEPTWVEVDIARRSGYEIDVNLPSGGITPPFAVRYAWQGSCCDLEGPGDDCPIASCPVAGSISQLPANPFLAIVTTAGCTCFPPQKCDIFDEEASGKTSATFPPPSVGEQQQLKQLQAAGGDAAVPIPLPPSPTAALAPPPTDAPGKHATADPTKHATAAPAKHATAAPAKHATAVPTKHIIAPSAEQPTGAHKQPTTAPTAQSTAIATKQPTRAPVKQPTIAPTKQPTEAPVKQPTIAPTKQPTGAPVKQPTIAPTKQPTGAPVKQPTIAPTKQPTSAPAKQPTVAPTNQPTVVSAKQPTFSPTKQPMVATTKQSTVALTNQPTTKLFTAPFDGAVQSPATAGGDVAGPLPPAPAPQLDPSAYPGAINIGPTPSLAATVLASGKGNAQSAVRFSPFMGDGMVLQRAPAAATVFGTVDAKKAKKGGGSGSTSEAKVTITVSSSSGRESKELYSLSATVTGTEFKALLHPEMAGTVVTVTAQCTHGCPPGKGATATLDDVVFGDVWYCAGSNNMATHLQYTMGRNKSKAAVEQGQYDNIRIFGLESNANFAQPWASPSDALAAGTFLRYSAACWYFAESLTDQLNGQAPALFGGDRAPPLGLVHVSVAQSKIEDWVDDEALALCADVSTRSGQNPRGWFPSRVAPFADKMSVKGFLFYQGEADMASTSFGNYVRRSGYACLQVELVNSWRARWSLTPGTTDSLAPFGIVTLHPTGSLGHEDIGTMRWAQTGGFGTLPNLAMRNTFLAHAFDLGDPYSDRSCYDAGCCGPDLRWDYGLDGPGTCVGDGCDICKYTGAQPPTCESYCSSLAATNFFAGPEQPRTKRTVGERLAHAAAVTVYGVGGGAAAAASGPTIAGCKKDGNVLIVRFDKTLLGGDVVDVRKYDRTNGMSKMQILIDPTHFCMQRSTANLSECIDDGYGHEIVGGAVDSNKWVAVDITGDAGRNEVIVDLSATGGIAHAVRYAWEGSCCPEGPEFIGKECPLATCPVVSRKSGLPANPFIAKISRLGYCQCIHPQTCHMFDEHAPRWHDPVLALGRTVFLAIAGSIFVAIIGLWRLRVKVMEAEAEEHELQKLTGEQAKFLTAGFSEIAQEDDDGDDLEIVPRQNLDGFNEEEADEDYDVW